MERFNCLVFQELLTGALDGELSRDERIRLDGHLVECSRCRVLQSRLERMETGFSFLPEVSPPFRVTT